MNNAILTIFGALAFVITYNYLAPRNSTDSESKRSGMVLHRDALTGCEYLRVGAMFAMFFGATLTPRLDRDGNPRCGVAEEKR